MYILGICDSQDAGAALFCSAGKTFTPLEKAAGKVGGGGDIDAAEMPPSAEPVRERSFLTGFTAVNEERLTRVKLIGGFPLKSINEVLALHNVKPCDIDLVVVASHMTPFWIFRLFRDTHASLRNASRQFSFLLSLYILYQVIARKSIVFKKIESLLSSIVLKRELRRQGIRAKIVNVEHHTAHAYAAYASCGCEEALVITADGLGDGVSFTVNIGRQGKIKRIFAQQALNDVTLYYSRLTEFLGFAPIKDEGKVMGLAAYSRDYSLLPEAEKLLRVRRGRFRKRNLFYFCSGDKKIFARLKIKDKAAVAASFQLHFEKTIADIVRYWVKKTNVPDIALSGGLFANIKVNQRIAELPEVKSVFVFPHMGDGGLAFGAICALRKIKPFHLRNIFWGRSFTDRGIRNVLDAQRVRYEIFDDIERYVAQLLSRGKIVARFCGAMEYGPRALGNRSILAAATDEKMQNILNGKLARDAFMPFAPAILSESIWECCIGVEKAAYAAEFMTMSFQCTERFKKMCPAVVHKDGTTRPQLVSEQSNASLYRILHEYKKLTGIPALMNTSFNIHEEPIVCTPEEALLAFKRGKLDYLAIGAFLVKAAEA
ncbi:MAG: hypothetical protein KJ893_06415 [Candidatus Omnitrophica bacterium]|nr:hypothetical protein [Candidatus Omnitrophota bacterium]MBU4477865.1 hypothetical protein [Candidatus Omnitrophota bacterium]MCG2704137.1 hypothetical protein [Candidatus Omnitrophota bacterium]